MIFIKTIIMIIKPYLFSVQWIYENRWYDEHGAVIYIYALLAGKSEIIFYHFKKVMEVREGGSFAWNDDDDDDVVGPI